MSSERDLVVVGEARALATMANEPTAVLEEARAAAVALQGVISQKKRPVIMGGEQYLEFEDWQTLGRFYGVTAGEERPVEYVEMGSVAGFRAHSVALRADGQVISRATAYCLNDEEKWSTRAKYEWAYVLKAGGTSVEDPGTKAMVWEDNPNKPGKQRPVKVREQVGEEKVPLYQLASMAQTRANAKCLRNVLSWVAVLAGYRPTPAEEMAGAASAAPETEEKGKGPSEGKKPSETEACPFCGSADFTVRQDGKAALCAQKECQKGWNLGR